jgi:hypothetical protein
MTMVSQSKRENPAGRCSIALETILLKETASFWFSVVGESTEAMNPISEN